MLTTVRSVHTVEGDISSFGDFDFVLEAEYLLVCPLGGQLALDEIISFRRSQLPSLLQPATNTDRAQHSSNENMLILMMAAECAYTLHPSYPQELKHVKACQVGELKG